MDDVRENDQCLFFVGVTIILMAESKKELESVCETVETIGKRNSCTIDTHYLKQREALNTALPIGVRQVETMRTLLTSHLQCLCHSMCRSLMTAPAIIMVSTRLVRM